MEKDMHDKIDQLIRRKDYSDLNPEERELIDENFGTESMYSRFRQAILQAQDSKANSISPKVKNVLISRMKKKRSFAIMDILEWKIPAYANLAALALIITFIWLFRPVEKVMVEKIKTVEIPAIPDTVYLASAPDTILQERIIEVKVPVYLTVKEDDNESVEEEKYAPQSSSLSEHRQLRSLIVSAP
jgi:hypothetical protein